MSIPQKIFYDSLNDLAVNLANHIAGNLEQGGLLVLPGGSSPRALITELPRTGIDWHNVKITTTDERCVPVDDEQSNAGQIKKLSGLEPVALWNNGEENIRALGWPATVTVLGMGTDAHIASLFPGSEIDMEAEGLVKTTAPSKPYDRVSLTMKTLLNTKSLILLVIGTEKWALCERILQGDHQSTPLAKLMGTAGDKLALHIVKS